MARMLIIVRTKYFSMAKIIQVVSTFIEPI